MAAEGTSGPSSLMLELNVSSVVKSSGSGKVPTVVARRVLASKADLQSPSLPRLGMLGVLHWALLVASSFVSEHISDIAVESTDRQVESKKPEGTRRA